MKGEFLKNRWLLLEKGSKTSERTTLFLTALSTGSLKLYFIVQETHKIEKMLQGIDRLLWEVVPQERWRY